MNKQELAKKYGVDQTRIVVIEQKSSIGTNLLVAIVLAILCVSFPSISIPVALALIFCKIMSEIFSILCTKDFWITIGLLLLMVVIFAICEEYVFISGNL